MENLCVKYKYKNVGLSRQMREAWQVWALNAENENNAHNKLSKTTFNS